jgi:hypothetical protein
MDKNIFNIGGILKEFDVPNSSGRIYRRFVYLKSINRKITISNIIERLGR